MNELAIASMHQPSDPRASSNKPRRLVGLPTPAYRLAERLALLRGVSMSDAIYYALRDDLHRQEDGDTWAYVPPPFSIKPTFFDGVMQVLLWNPHLDGVVMSGSEAVRLADGINQAIEGPLPSDFKVTGKRGERALTVTLSRAANHVSLHCDGLKYAMVRPVAADVAAALDSASVGSGPIPTHDAFAA